MKNRFRQNFYRKTGLLSLLFLLVGLSVQAATPQRIISLAPSLTKSLYMLGADDLLVGCTSFCTLQKPDDAEVVASAVKVNLEKAMLLKPDLVLTSSLTSPETKRAFEKLGVEVLYFPYPKSYGEMCRYLLRLGEKIGRKELAEKLVAESKARLAKAIATVPATDHQPRVFMQIGANPLFTVVPNTFMQDFIDFSGCENIAADLEIGSITREGVLVRNPDVIFVILMGSLSVDEKEKWESYPALNAVKNHKIFVLDSEKTCSPTPLDFVDALEQMIGMIYN
ncbi:ABC transporter substrate-binding protein [Mangrovibacterium marinum]|uniref:Iron complex transport system substrate-binding protein n=1 Tax=Mangrovibacterium marinum TaxID=1639118 RepID=A0A2T5BX98_9BACT|nr:helical backbone metal receptor [Mangrovibacterium marinum]PTN04791.1 iron complex transport system substrate-binding protein [Mangrovibacterium marinum]